MDGVTGSAKLPNYAADTVPPVAEIGPGSPTGVFFGHGARFPAQYQNAVYVLDWTFGRIYAMHLTPDGAGFTAKKEVFLSRKALPLTDGAIGPDGAMYVTVGGRTLASSIYRITYTGDGSTAPASPPEQHPLAATRAQLETLHRPDAANAVEEAWPYLSHNDRLIRYAARIAIERRPYSEWRDKLSNEKNADGFISGSLAAARRGDAADRDLWLQRLANLDRLSLSESQRLDRLRAMTLLCSRYGMPSEDTRQHLLSKLDPVLPTGHDFEDRELTRLLIYLDSDTILEKALALLAKKYQRTSRSGS